MTLMTGSMTYIDVYIATAAPKSSAMSQPRIGKYKEMKYQEAGKTIK